MKILESPNPAPAGAGRDKKNEPAVSAQSAGAASVYTTESVFHTTDFLMIGQIISYVLKLKTQTYERPEFQLSHKLSRIPL